MKKVSIIFLLSLFSISVFADCNVKTQDNVRILNPFQLAVRKRTMPCSGLYCFKIDMLVFKNQVQIDQIDLRVGEFAVSDIRSLLDEAKAAGKMIYVAIPKSSETVVNKTVDKLLTLRPDTRIGISDYDILTVCQ